MKLWFTLRNAALGWQQILAGDAGWRGRFGLTMPGLVIALVIFAFAAFLAVALASMNVGMPNVFGIVAAMFVLALPVTAFVVTLMATRLVLGQTDSMLPMLVPGIYALTAFLLVEGFLALFGGPIVMMSWLAIGYLLYRLARVSAGWNLGVAAGFAVLTVLLLVAMRLALYMLTSPAGSPT
jgi:hypothetical protein